MRRAPDRVTRAIHRCTLDRLVDAFRIQRVERGRASSAAATAAAATAAVARVCTLAVGCALAHLDGGCRKQRPAAVDRRRLLDDERRRRRRNKSARADFARPNSP